MAQIDAIWPFLVLNDLLSSYHVTTPHILPYLLSRRIEQLTKMTANSIYSITGQLTDSEYVQNCG